MARLSFVALLTLAFSGVAFATPVVSDLHARDSVQFFQCGGTAASVTGVSVSPFPPESGTQTTVTINVDAWRTIVQGSYARVTANRGAEPLSSQIVNFCETVDCPIAGPFSFNFDFAMPKDIPANEITVITEGYPPYDSPPQFCAGFRPAGQ